MYVITDSVHIEVLKSEKMAGPDEIYSDLIHEEWNGEVITITFVGNSVCIRKKNPKQIEQYSTINSTKQ